ncbi:hypothetical protein FVE85_2535 [Porphyridium purpureum]|uniref:Uncharacterized protein n=1 Tax=Porphyridium purpureum TaxID=35688 RepID=A0A5J4YKV3_PORPP|nr:hypothetical protein FVE85_2535 [Porphyridium purpureum]|eukprot:POR2453..scf291_13
MAGTLLAVSPFLTPALRRHVLPYVPATDQQLADVLTLCRRAVQASRGTPARGRALRMVDLGSGDGRVCRALWREFSNRNDIGGEVSVTGVEMNFWLVLFSRMKAMRLSGAGVRTPHGHGGLTYIRGDLFALDFGGYDLVVLFGVDGSFMADIENKLTRDFAARRMRSAHTPAAESCTPSVVSKTAASACEPASASAETSDAEESDPPQPRRAAVVCTRFALPTWKSHAAQGLAWLYFVDEQPTG